MFSTHPYSSSTATVTSLRGRVLKPVGMNIPVDPLRTTGSDEGIFIRTRLAKYLFYFPFTSPRSWGTSLSTPLDPALCLPCWYAHAVMATANASIPFALLASAETMVRSLHGAQQGCQVLDVGVHAPKCGSSFANTIFHFYCPNAPSTARALHPYMYTVEGYGPCRPPDPAARCAPTRG